MDIRLDDLTGNQREIAELIGLDNYIKLSKRYGGDSSIYIQKYSEIVKAARNREIRKKYNGYNVRQLARMYNLSEQHIRLICHCSNGNEDQLTF